MVLLLVQQLGIRSIKADGKVGNHIKGEGPSAAVILAGEVAGQQAVLAPRGGEPSLVLNQLQEILLVCLVRFQGVLLWYPCRDNQDNT